MMSWLRQSCERAEVESSPLKLMREFKHHERERHFAESACAFTAKEGFFTATNRMNTY